MQSLFTLLSLGAPTVLGGAAAAAWIALYPPVPRDLGGAANLDDEAEPARIPLPDGDRLDGWRLPGSGAADVLLLHGYGRTHHRMWRYAGFLREAGFGVLAIDFRSSRQGRRLPTTLGAHERVDAQAALDWLRARSAGRLAVMGESLGATVALLLAADNPDVAATVADCPFANGRQAVEDMMSLYLRLPRWPTAPLMRHLGRLLTGCDPFGADALAAAARLRHQPILFIHSERDERVSLRQTEWLWEAGGRRHDLWRVPGAGHNQGWLRHRQEYERRVLAFLAESLGRQPSELGQALP
jgi:dipeptidyl aminopeptidase/acylaminoacyl peptidase